MGDSFDIKYKLMPPELQMRLWVLALDANTSKVNIAYDPGSFRTSLAYEYGGNLHATLGIRRTYSFGLEFDPATANVNARLGMVFRGFNFESTADVAKRSVGINLTYGRKLLPFPDELSRTFDAANSGLVSIAGDIRMAPNNPLAWYKLHSDDVDAISKAVDVGRKISAQSEAKDRVGFGLRLNYTQQSGFLIYGGVGIWF